MELHFKHPPPLLTLSQLRTARSVNADGSISFANLLDYGDASIVATAINLPRGVTYDDMDRVVLATLKSPALPTNFSKDEFLSIATGILNSMRRNLEKEYIVFSGITLSGRRPSRSYNIGSALVAFPSSSDSVVRKIQKSHNNLIQQHYRLFAPPVIEVPHRPILAYVKARTVDQALDMGRDAFDDVRGLMNLFENQKTYSRKTYGKQYPINKAKLLPILTVHNPDGTAAIGQIWYDRAWEPPSTSLDPHRDINGFTENFPKWIARIRNRHGLSESAQVALRHYVRSIDYSDWRQAFLGLWTVIEYLTSARDADYERLVKRASKIFHLHEQQKEVLQHLRTRRNQLIHEASDAPVSETIVFQAKSIVEPFIRFALANRLKLRNRQELADFLDLPTDANELARRVALAKKAIQFIRR